MEKKKKYKSNRDIGVWAGIIILLINRIFVDALLLYFVLWLIGVVLVFWGCWSWTQYKGQSGWWTLWAFISPIGFIPLAIMKDKFIVEETRNEQTHTLV